MWRWETAAPHFGRTACLDELEIRKSGLSYVSVCAPSLWTAGRILLAFGVQKSVHHRSVPCIAIIWSETWVGLSPGSGLECLPNFGLNSLLSFGPECLPTSWLECLPSSSLECLPSSWLECLLSSGLECLGSSGLECLPCHELECLPSSELGCPPNFGQECLPSSD
jgi:hypothetical protein